MELPDVLPGHWESPEGREMAQRYAGQARSDLMMADKSDLGIANAVFLIDRNSLDLITIQQAAKDRIRWLSAQLALANLRADAIRAATIDECAAAAEAQDRIGYEWVRDSLWDVICRRAGTNVLALHLKG